MNALQIEKKTLLISDEPCLKCDSKGKVEFSRYLYYKTFFGKDARKHVSGFEDCPHCMGTKKVHYKEEILKCKTCKGFGRISVWKKGFFGREVETIITCPTCHGEKIQRSKSEFPYWFFL